MPPELVELLLELDELLLELDELELLEPDEPEPPQPTVASSGRHRMSAVRVVLR
jgi:hypothetical protein